MNTPDEMYATSSSDNDVGRICTFFQNSKIILIINGEWPCEVEVIIFWVLLVFSSYRGFLNMLIPQK